MKTLIILKSLSTKNTEKIAKAISHSINAAIVSPDSVDEELIEKYDLIGIGSGIYFNKHHKSLFRMLEKIGNAKGKNAFIFSTSGFGSLSLHNPLKKIMIEKGFNIIEEFSTKAFDCWGPLKIIGGINKGRPNEKDIQKAKDFAINMKKKITEKNNR